jgi:hypothetical protein
MSHTITHKHQHVPVSVIITLAVVVILIGAIIVTPYITLPGSAVIPVTGNQNTYYEYIRGEKVIYAMPVLINNAITAYRLGEKTLYGVYNSNEVLSVYRYGEKNVMSTQEYALLNYHMGEKDY